mmetsp:Transcript_14353/g.39136  ORF Transcript_14353/g.39136 Transcript_14353/m.39136 type:complete len:98 (+) Transcript_14353:224-517(+)
MVKIQACFQSPMTRCLTVAECTKMVQSEAQRRFLVATFKGRVQNVADVRPQRAWCSGTSFISRGDPNQLCARTTIEQMITTKLSKHHGVRENVGQKR